MTDNKTVEAVISCLRQLALLCKKLVDILRSVPKDVQAIKGDLNRLQASIVAAAREELTPEQVNEVKKMKKAVFEIEDIIDDYESSEGWQLRDLGCATLPHETAGYVKTTKLHLEIAWRIHGIRSIVQEIEESQTRKKREADSKRIPSLYETQSNRSKGNPDITWQNLRELPHRLELTEIVGFEDTFRKLIDCLENGRQECTIIAVVGLGGLGKTTLACKVKHHIIDRQQEETRNQGTGYFNCLAWVTVCRSFDYKEKMLRSMLEQFYRGEQAPLPRDISTMNLEELKDMVKEYLRHKRYVVFFDDVWAESFWDEIISALDDSRCKSRIIITTRNKDVVSKCKRSHVKELPIEPLTKDESLELFERTAFLNVDDKDVLRRHRVISSLIVEKCMYSPLGIVAIGGEIAADEKFPHEWEKHVKMNSDIAKILSLGYDDLPEYLKPCLLYFGMYPENYHVTPERLIRQWIAEGFIIPERNKTLEKVAESYLEMLINRHWVQVSSFTTDGTAKYSVPYLVRIMILKISEDLSFSQIICEDSRLDKEDIIRRLSITSENSASANDSHEKNITYSFMRSLLFFTQKESDVFLRKALDVSEYTKSILTQSKQLKVLDFEGALLCDVPEMTENLIKLKYLSFRSTDVEKLPNSIGILQNLETLDLRDTGVKEIPKEVSMLRKLQHLLGTDMRLTQLKDRIEGMKFLQTLHSVKVEDNDDESKLIKNLEKIEKMRDLGLTNVVKEHGSTLCSSLNVMNDLEKLHIVAKAENEIDLQNLRKRSNLRKLHLQGKLSRLPEWISQLQYLYQLVLSMCKLDDNQLNLLKNCLSLKFLSIIDEGYQGASLCFQDGGFNYLEALELGSLPSLNSIIIDEEALPSLRKLVLRNIRQLKMEGVKNLKNLEDFNIEDMSAESVQSIDVDSIIEHVPHVRINGQQARQG